MNTTSIKFLCISSWVFILWHVLSIKRCLTTSTKHPPLKRDPPSNQVIPMPSTRSMMHFRKKEACGTPSLACLVAFAERLSKSPEFMLRVDMEFPVLVDKLKTGQKPACDGALCALTLCGRDPLPKPLILYEYKPIVDPRCEAVNEDHLMEVLLQGYYCLRQYKLPTIIHCLTDLYQWYYFKLVLDGDKIECKWYREFISEAPQLADMESHVSFLDLCISTE